MTKEDKLFLAFLVAWLEDRLTCQNREGPLAQMSELKSTAYVLWTSSPDESEELE